MSEQSEPSNIVEFPELKFPPIEYGVTEAALSELADRYKEPDASSDEGYAHCKDGCKELTSLRTAVETRRKDLKAPALTWGHSVDKLAKNLIRRIKVIETPVRVEKERIDEIKQEEARKAAEAEQKRIDDIRNRIDTIAGSVREQQPGDKAANYKERIDLLNELNITEDVFGELVDEANTTRDVSLFKLTQWHEQAVTREADDKRRKTEQAEIDRKKKELDKIEAQQKKEATRIETEKREAEEHKAAAEKAEKAEKAKSEREEREKDSAEKRRLSRIDAAINIRKTMPDRARGMTSLELGRLIAAEEQSTPSKEEFAEFLPDAVTARDTSLETLKLMLVETRANEDKARRDDEARLPDKDKLKNWISTIQSEADVRPQVLNNSAQKILKRYGDDLNNLLAKASAAIEKL